MTSVLFSEAIGVVWDLTNCPQKVTGKLLDLSLAPVDREWAVRVPRLGWAAADEKIFLLNK